jgi:alpha-ketoglutarate-dependent taurine dioxygenase
MQSSLLAEQPRASQRWKTGREERPSWPAASIRWRTACAAAAAEITGVDLAAPLDERTFAEIEATFDRSGVIVIRDQRITPAQQLAFARRFGDIEVNFHSARYGLPEHPEIYRISNITKDGKPIGSRRAGENWHSDMIYSARPPRATMLYAIEVPELHGLTLGDTAFANAAAAYEALPDAMKRRIEGLKGIFDFTGRKRSGGPRSSHGRALSTCPAPDRAHAPAHRR